MEDYKHGLASQLATLQSELARVGDVMSRRNEREFSVTEGAWDRLVRAAGSAQGLVTGPTVPNFKQMDHARAMLVIENSPFTELERDDLRSTLPDDRDELFAQFEQSHRVRSSRDSWAEFKNFVSTRQIFFSSTIYEALLLILDDLNKVLIPFAMYAERGQQMPLEDRIKAGKFLRVELNERIDELARIIRGQFGFTNAPAQPAAPPPAKLMKPSRDIQSIHSE
jgi:hypothetical protein